MYYLSNLISKTYFIVTSKNLMRIVLQLYIFYYYCYFKVSLWNFLIFFFRSYCLAVKFIYPTMFLFVTVFLLYCLYTLVSRTQFTITPKHNRKKLYSNFIYYLSKTLNFQMLFLSHLYQYFSLISWFNIFFQSISRPFFLSYYASF